MIFDECVSIVLMEWKLINQKSINYQISNCTTISCFVPNVTFIIWIALLTERTHIISYISCINRCVWYWSRPEWINHWSVWAIYERLCPMWQCHGFGLRWDITYNGWVYEYIEWPTAEHASNLHCAQTAYTCSFMYFEYGVIRTQFAEACDNI